MAALLSQRIGVDAAGVRLMPDSSVCSHMLLWCTRMLPCILLHRKMRQQSFASRR